MNSIALNYKEVQRVKQIERIVSYITKKIFSTDVTGTIAYHLFKSHFKLSTDRKSKAFLQELQEHVDFNTLAEYCDTLVDVIGGEDLERILDIDITKTSYERLKAMYDIIVEDVRYSYGKSEPRDHVYISALMNMLNYTRIERTPWMSVEHIAKVGNMFTAGATDEHYWPRRLATKWLIEDAVKGHIPFERFLADIIGKYTHVHSVTKRENDRLAAKHQRESGWTDLNKFHPHVPYLLNNVMLINRETGEHYMRDDISEIKEAMKYVVDKPEGEIKVYADKLLTFGQFDIELPEVYTPKEDTKRDRHMLDVIAILQTYFEPSGDHKVTQAHLVNFINERLGLIREITGSTLSNIMAEFIDQGHFLYTTTTRSDMNMNGWASYAGMKPKDEFRGKIKFFKYDDVDGYFATDEEEDEVDELEDFIISVSGDSDAPVLEAASDIGQ